MAVTTPFFLLTALVSGLANLKLLFLFAIHGNGIGIG